MKMPEEERSMVQYINLRHEATRKNGLFVIHSTCPITLFHDFPK